MKLISTDTEKCILCNKCKVVCPMGIIAIPKGGFPESVRDAFKLCINCGYCVDVCDYDALFHKVRKRTGSARAALKRYDSLMEIKRGKNEG